MEEYSYIGIPNADNVEIMIQELQERNAKLKEQLEDIKRLRSMIEDKKSSISENVVSIEQDFVDLGNILPRVKVEKKEKPEVQKVERKEIHREELNLEELRKEFEKLKREFSQF